MVPLVSSAVLTHLYVQSSPRVASRKTQVCKNRTEREARYGKKDILGPVYTERDYDHDHERDHCDFPRDFPLESSHEPPFIQNAVLRAVTVVMYQVSRHFLFLCVFKITAVFVVKNWVFFNFHN